MKTIHGSSFRVFAFGAVSLAGGVYAGCKVEVQQDTCADNPTDPACIDASECVDDGACDADEPCECTDCVEELECADCTEVGLADVPAATSFVEGLLDPIEGAGDDMLQGFGLGGATAGTTIELTAATSFSDCSSRPCLNLSIDGGATFYTAVAGTIDVVSTDPTVLTLSNVVFFPRTVDGDNFVVDLEGPCIRISSGTIPTP